MEIRQAASVDVPVVEVLVERAYSPYIAEIGVRPGPLDDDYAERVARGGTFLAVEGKAVRGLIVLVEHSDHLLVENVAVDPDRQGEGIGRALLGHAEAVARAAGLAEVRLYTHARMTSNRALYLALGFRQVDRRDEDGFDRVFFVKPLVI
jgi:ribosomal protein S18 acetylase RimI-like enzyme